MKGFTKDGKFHPIRNKRSPSKIRKASGLSTSLGAIISPKKRPPAVLLKEIRDDLDFRSKLIDTNKEIKAEIKADPESSFAHADREEFKENAKEIQQVAKEIKRTYRDIPKDERQNIDRDIINRLRLLR